MPSDNLFREEAVRRAEQVQVNSYDVDLQLDGDPQSPTFTSTSTIDFNCQQPGSTTFIDLEAQRITSASLNGMAWSPEIAQNRIQVPGLQAHNQLTITAECAYTNTGIGIHRAIDPEDGGIYLHSHAEPFEAHRFFACFDQPDLKASFKMRVTAPASWQVISNSPLTRREEIDKSLAQSEFAPTKPLSTYLAAVVAGPYASEHTRHGSIDMGLFCRQSLRRYLEEKEIFEVSKAGFDFYTDFFGIPYPFEKYDQLIVPEFNAGAMENAGCITFSEFIIFRGPVPLSFRSWRASTILHEMAHMWFGDLVTMRWWDDLWLNESFASFMALLAQMKATRYTNGWMDFANGDKARAAKQDQLPTTHPIATMVTDINVGRLNFDGISYDKGAATLRQLAAWIGMDALKSGMREYFQQFQWSNATLQDFLSALQEASGRDLQRWSKDWLQSAGMNILRPAATDDGQKYTSFAVVQEAAMKDWPTLRQHRLGIGLYRYVGPALRRHDYVEVDIDGARTDVPEIAGKPIADLVLLNDGDLTFAKLRLDERSVQTLVSSLADIDDPLTRSLCWACLWDMCRDAELPTQKFVQIFRKHAVREAAPTLVDDLVIDALSGVERFAAPSSRAELRASIADTAWEMVNGTDPGGDLQTSWVRCFVNSAADKQNIERMRALFDGTQRVAGLEIDQDLRWMMVRRLAARDNLGADEIDRELRRDSTDIGQRQAAAAKAARPSAEAKEWAWRQLIDEHLALAMIRAISNDFQGPDQEALTQPYIQRYAEVVPELWHNRTYEEAEWLTRTLYPAYVSNDEVLDVADRLLGNESLPQPGRRVLEENKDQTLRMSRARAFDATQSAESSRVS